MITEQQILNLIRKITPNSQKYLHDDAAVIENNLLVTTDSLIENTHFRSKDYTPAEVGWKALAANLSDIAAMGGKPMYALVSLSLPKSVKMNWIKEFYKGVNTCAKKYKTQIVGGNLSRSNEINVTITLIGKAISKNLALRSNSKVGDLVFASGPFGKSIKKPVVPLNTGQKMIKLTNRVSLMDSSDGLADCLIQIANESKVKIIIEAEKIPISKGIKANKKSSLEMALYNGEDYKLVGTTSKNGIKKLKRIKGIKILGNVIRGKGAYLKYKDGKLIKLDMKKGFKHFS